MGCGCSKSDGDLNEIKLSGRSSVQQKFSFDKPFMPSRLSNFMDTDKSSRVFSFEAQLPMRFFTLSEWCKIINSTISGSRSVTPDSLVNSLRKKTTPEIANVVLSPSSLFT